MPLGGKREVTNRAFDPEYHKRRQKKVSRKQERRVAKKLGGSRVSLSGAGEEKGDAKTKLNLIELKRTAKKSIRVERRWLEKIAIEAYAEGKVPAFGFSFDEYDNSTLVPKDWIAVPAEFLRELTDGFSND